MKTGVRHAIAAALLFGASTPVSKHLLAAIPPVTLAGLLYLGAGLGLAAWRIFSRRMPPAATEAALSSADWPWLGGAIFFGGIAGPILLLAGLRATPAATGSLLLNLEAVFTALLAWLVFREHCSGRTLLGMAAIVAGGIALTWKSDAASLVRVSPSALAIVGACLCWAADNNLTRKVSSADPAQIAMWKGLVAGTVNLALAWQWEQPVPGSEWLLAGALGFLSYGLSLAAFVLALRHLGTARTGAYFSTAPFIGVALSIVFLHETPAPSFWPAALLMATGVWLHLTERHVHEHLHEEMEHEHSHEHDIHHQHDHLPTDPPSEPHSHRHRHARLVHSHPHAPDLHHQHRHD